MSVVSLLGVKVLNNPAGFLSPYQFEITFECLEQLQKGEEASLPNIGFLADPGLQIWNGNLLMSALLPRK